MQNEVWENIFTSQQWGKYPAEPLIRFVARNYYNVKAREDVRFLELGCGPGANLWYLAREGFSFVGIDGSASAIEIAEKRLDKDCPGWRSRGKLLVKDISLLNYEENYFDAVIDNECVYCLPLEEAKKIYAEASHLLKPDGKLFVRTFSTDSWGFNTGKKVDDFGFFCSEGPLAGKGYSRFTARDQILDIFCDYKDLSVETITNSHEGGEKIIAEWIIEGRRV